MRYGGIVLALAILVGCLVMLNRGHAEQAGAKERATSGPHYTVLETEGTNLVVTDNETSTLYFYTVDKGKAPGAELKLRAKVDLNMVGKPTIQPVDVNIQK
jgi:hypothetical protein